MKPIINFVVRSEISPYFGYANPSQNTVWVRADLPDRVKDFVLSHELYHLTDPTTNVLLRELKANFFALKEHTIGGIWCFLLTVINKDRWLLYFYRFTKNF